MDDKKKILLSSEDVISKKASDLFINIDLQRTYNLIAPSEYENNFNLLTEFKKERNSCRNFRIYGTINSSRMDCDNISLDIYSNSGYTASEKIGTIKTFPAISNAWDDFNNYGFKRGKYLLSLDNYNNSNVYVVFDNGVVRNEFPLILIFTATTYDILGNQIVEVIDYGTQSTDYNIDGSQVVVNNDFPFFYNKHWIENDFLIKYPGRSKLTYSVLPSFGYGGIDISGPILEQDGNYYIFTQGGQASLNALTAAHISFVGWTGDINGSNTPINITMDSDKTVTANFKKDYIPSVRQIMIGIPDPPVYSVQEFQSTVVDKYKVYTVNEGTVAQLVVSLSQPAITGLESVIVEAEVKTTGAPITQTSTDILSTSSLSAFPMMITFAVGEHQKTIMVDTSNNFNYPSDAGTIYAVIFSVKSTNLDEVSTSVYSETYKNWLRVIESNNQVEMKIDSSNYTTTDNITTYALSEYQEIPIKLTLSNTPVGNEEVRVVVFGENQQEQFSPYLPAFLNWNEGGEGKTVTFAPGEQSKTVTYSILPKDSYGTTDPMERLIFQISETKNVSVASSNVFGEQQVLILDSPDQNLLNFNIEGTIIPPYNSDMFTLNQITVGNFAFLKFELVNEPTGLEKFNITFTPFDGITYYSPDIVPDIAPDNNIVEWAAGDDKVKWVKFVTPTTYTYTTDGTQYTTGQITAVLVHLTNLEGLVLNNTDTEQTILPINNQTTTNATELTMTMNADVDYEVDSIAWSMNMGETKQIYFTLNQPSITPITVSLVGINTDPTTLAQYGILEFPINVTIDAGHTAKALTFPSIVGQTGEPLPISFEVQVGGIVLSDYNKNKNHSIIINRA